MNSTKQACQLLQKTKLLAPHMSMSITTASCCSPCGGSGGASCRGPCEAAATAAGTSGSGWWRFNLRNLKGLRSKSNSHQLFTQQLLRLTMASKLKSTRQLVLNLSKTRKQIKHIAQALSTHFLKKKLVELWTGNHVWPHYFYLADY